MTIEAMWFDYYYMSQYGVWGFRLDNDPIEGQKEREAQGRWPIA